MDHNLPHWLRWLVVAVPTITVCVTLNTQLGIGGIGIAFAVGAIAGPWIYGGSK